jgi:FlaA1/EpsC-like NDP-sugar epimerase
MLNHFTRLADPLLSLPRMAKSIIVSIVDSGLCVLTVWLAFYLRLGEFQALTGPSLLAAVVSIAIALPIFVSTGLYRAIFRYSGWPALLSVTKAIALYGTVYVVIFTLIGIQGVPRTVGLIQPILLLLLVGGTRAIVHFLLGGAYQGKLKLAAIPKVMIYGAGESGRQLIAALANSNEMRVIGFLDDDPQLHGRVLNGKKIYSPSELEKLKQKFGVFSVLLAMPSLSRAQRNVILQRMLSIKINVRTLPSMTELAQGKVTISDIRELDIDDLLGRDPVAPDQALLSKNIAGKTVLVTGAGGSIGSELCRQIVDLAPAVLLLFDQNEYALYSINQELLAHIETQKLSVKLIALLGSVRDEERVREVMSSWQPHTIYHAAAYKHVPLVEHNLTEGIRNNVFGTLNVAKAAIAYEVSHFVLISTDKAVRPTNVMGASKRLAEMLLQALVSQSAVTRFSMVRFGNVLGSSGSVVPLFREQIRNMGPLTLTHLDITRFFMSIPEAAQLVIQAGAMASGGEVFLLDMGQPVKIYDLAHRMVQLSGLTIKGPDNPNGDIEIQVVGLRPGEKLYEELLIGDKPETTTHPRIMKSNEDYLPMQELTAHLQTLEEALREQDVMRVRALLQTLVVGYTPNSEIVDLVYMNKSQCDL